MVLTSQKSEWMLSKDTSRQQGPKVTTLCRVARTVSKRTILNCSALTEATLWPKSPRPYSNKLATEQAVFVCVGVCIFQTAFLESQLDLSLTSQIYFVTTGYTLESQGCSRACSAVNRFEGSTCSSMSVPSKLRVSVSRQRSNRTLCL
jgi:hypothetical protein